MQFGVLGPLVVVDDQSREHRLPPKEEHLLAALLASANQAVSVDRLLEELWPSGPPATAGKTLQTYVSHLRRIVGGRLETRAPGYALAVRVDEIDARQFEHDVTEGRRALLRGEYRSAVATLARALDRWGGDAFSGLDGPAISAEARRLDELRAAVLEDWFDARFGVGDDRDLTVDLERAVVTQPTRERLWSLLMRSLYRDGRQTDALQTFQRARRFLVDEFGVEPGPALQAIEAAVLRHDASLGSKSSDAPRPTYATTPDGLRIGYVVAGNGSGDGVVFVTDTTLSVELLWQLDEFGPILTSMERGRRLVAVQRRGTGISDPDGATFSPPEACVGDIDAVLADVGAATVDLVGWGHGAQVALAYAATAPERVRRLALVNPYARLSLADDYEHGFPADALQQFLDRVATVWGRPESKWPIFAPNRGADPELIERMSRVERLTASPGHIVAVLAAVNGFDVRWALPKIGCLTLVVFLSQSVTGAANARYVAEQIRDARYVELAGYFVPTVDEAGAVATVLDDFLTAG